MTKKKSLAKQTLQYYWRHMRKFPHLYIPAAIISPINTVVGTYLPPLVLADVINKLNKHEYTAHHVWASFGTDIILFAVFSIAGTAVFWRIFDMCWWRLEGRMHESILSEVFNHLIEQSADFHANQFSGSLVSAANKLTSSYVRIADTTLFQVLPLFLGLVFVSIVMISRSPFYTLALLLFSVFYIIASFFVTQKVRQKGAEVATAESRQTGTLADAVSNVMAIKSFAHERDESLRFNSVIHSTYEKLMSMMYAFQRQQISLGSVGSVLSIVALVVAIVDVVTYGGNLATAFLIFNYTSSIAGQLFGFSNNSLRNFNRSFGDANDMLDILSVPAQIRDPDTPEQLHIHSGEIAFESVNFTHDGADDALFSDFKLHVQPGEKIGLIGHSGSGKTTFTRLLLRFSDIDSGQILIDGQDITKITQSDLHSKIAYVPQEPLLFHRSIRENIAYGDLNASDDAIHRAASLAHAAEFIDTLPDGYETLVGERGVKLSGGQRQRIAIARAMLKDAPILALDEATSALDSESEVLIQSALWKLMEGRTAIVIAHRLSTIQKMDRIVVLDDGKIVEQGTHKQLLAKKGGTYAKLWAHQSGGFIEE